jgi:transposase
VRNKFKQVIEKLNPADLVYVDESGLDESLSRDYARSPQGQRIMSEKSGKRTARTSIIAGLNQGEPIAPWHFPGYCNTEVMLTWVEKELIRCLTPGMTVIWDNASFHKSPKLKSLIENAGCHLLFLPPYSPDLNPIEKWWAKLKAIIRKIRTAKMTISRVLAKVFKLSR